MGDRKTLTVGVSVLLMAALMGGVLYGLRQDVAPEGEARSPPRTRVEPDGTAVDRGRPRAEPPAVAPPGPATPLEPEARPPAGVALAPAPQPEVRSRSLASLRGSISRVLRTCSPRLTGGPVRVFVSMEAVVGGGRIHPEAVQVRTSTPTNDEFVRCMGDAVRAVSVPAAAGEPDGSFPATVSLLSSSP